MLVQPPPRRAPKSEIEFYPKEKFPAINSRYRGGGYSRAKFNYESAPELVKFGDLELPDRIVFGRHKILK